MSRVIVHVIAFCLAAALCVSAAHPLKDPRKEKPVEEMNQEELVELLTDSPWAHKEDLWQLTGRILADLANGRVAIYRESPTSPPVTYSIPTVRTRPERMHSEYVVRWSRARIVMEALLRLRELSGPLADMQAPPDRIPPGHFVITVRVAKPPTPSAADRLARAQVFRNGSPLGSDTFEPRDIFFAKEDEELIASAELRTNDDRRVAPSQVFRHGMGAGEGITFVFPESQESGPLIGQRTQWVEFRFKDKLGNTLKTRFRLRDMRISGESDT